MSNLNEGEVQVTQVIYMVGVPCHRETLQDMSNFSICKSKSVSSQQS